jgi:hypothetical protein
MLWETKRTVDPESLRSYILWIAFFLNAESPAERASSMTRTSGSTLIATAKPRRLRIPLE